jgi:hypothetical protein
MKKKFQKKLQVNLQNKIMNWIRKHLLILKKSLKIMILPPKIQSLLKKVILAPMICSNQMPRKFNLYLLLILIEPRISLKVNYLNRVINFRANNLLVLKIVKMILIRLIEPRVHWE